MAHYRNRQTAPLNDTLHLPHPLTYLRCATLFPRLPHHHPMFAALLRIADAAYRHGTPLLTDEAFDRLARICPNALPPLGGDMLSLDCPPDPTDWLDTHASEPMVIQLKADGVSVALDYHDGLLTGARLRSGRDVTAMAIRAGALTDLPGRPSGHVVVRVEACAPTTSRNACAAALRRGNADFRIMLLAFGASGLPTTTHTQTVQWLGLAGFATLCCVPLTSPTDLPEIFDAFKVNRHLLAFACDGLVVSINNTARQRQLGACSRAPKWAISIKP
jgi:DNA ligase (NAD+)